MSSRPRGRQSVGNHEEKKDHGGQTSFVPWWIMISWWWFHDFWIWLAAVSWSKTVAQVLSMRRTCFDLQRFKSCWWQESTSSARLPVDPNFFEIVFDPMNGSPDRRFLVHCFLWGWLCTSFVFNTCGWKSSKGMLGVIYGIERARVCELRNVDSDRPLSQVGRALWMKLETVIVLKKIISTPGRFLIYLHCFRLSSVASAPPFKLLKACLRALEMATCTPLLTWFQTGVLANSYQKHVHQRPVGRFIPIFFVQGGRVLRYNHQRPMGRFIPYNHQRPVGRFIRIVKVVGSLLRYNHQRPMGRFIPILFEKTW